MGFLRFSECVLMFFKIYFANTKKLSTFAFPNVGNEWFRRDAGTVENEDWTGPFGFVLI